MLSSFLLLIFHIKKKLYYVTSVLPKIGFCGFLFLVFFFFHWEYVFILQDCDFSRSEFGREKHIQICGSLRKVFVFELKKLYKNSSDV